MSRKREFRLRGTSSGLGSKRYVARHGAPSRVPAPAENAPEAHAPAPAENATPRPRKTIPWAAKVVPAAVIAATLAAGAAAYAVTAGPAGQPAPGGLMAAMSSLPAAATRSGHSDAMNESRPNSRAASPSARPSASPRPAARRPAASPRGTQGTASPAAKTLTCSDTSSLLPLNVTAIVSFLTGHGYSDVAAAGIAGNIYQESKGDPESEGSGGGGLIGFTPLPAGYVTGNAAADLQTQLSAILTYNQQWAAYLPELNAAATPAEAADIFVTDFERAGIPMAGTREASAEAVAAACGL